jgi:hypothetical protein
MADLQVQVGDRLALFDYSTPKRIVTVSRVLKQYFETEGGEKWNFRGTLRASSRRSYGWLSLKPLTPEVEVQLQRKLHLERIRFTGADTWAKLSDEQLSQVVGIINTVSAE